MPTGNTTCQMGGWFRKEIKSVEDLSGLKMRIGVSLTHRRQARPGAAAAGGGDIFPALEKGTIDAAGMGRPL
jgi:TRAP-type mannitol/chloroaromatic compound transport system substrate-binding protein